MLAVTREMVTAQFGPTPLRPQRMSVLPALTGAATQVATGFWRLSGTTAVAGRVRLLPFADTSPGGTFSVQVWGWWNTSEDPDKNVLLPLLLCELACVVGDIPGPYSLTQPNGCLAMRPGERLCDQITVVRGGDGSARTLGPWGELISHGAGSGLAAAAVVDTRAAQYVQFLFDAKRPEPLAMNAWWART